MGAEQHVPAQIERVLSVEGRVVFREVEREEVGALGLSLGTHVSGECAGLASQDLGLEIGQPALVRLRNFLQTLPQLGEGCQEVAHGQSACLATSASCSNATGSRTARSASTLRLISTPALRSPFMRRL